MLNEVILIDTNEIKKENKIYYILYTYIPSLKAFNEIFVDKNTYDYCVELPSYEDITNICVFRYDRKSSCFKLNIVVKNV